MAAASLKKLGALIALAVLVFSLVAVPGIGGVVIADGVGTGQPIEPPPDTSEVTVSPGGEIDPWTEFRILVSTVSSMML